MVYLVDDDVDDLQTLQEALFNNSYKGPVKTAINGVQLMNELRKLGGSETPNVIVLDLNMPLKNGFQVLEEIKNQPAFNDIPVIVLTACTNNKDERRCLDLGCRYFFRKPYSMPEYSPIVATVKMFTAA